MNFASINSSICQLTLFEDGENLIALEWGRAPHGESTPLLIEAIKQLQAYFDGRLKKFSLPLKPSGTPFQRSVWALMADIPYGGTSTYGDLAKRLGSAPRAVGGACGRNPIPIIIPCHRVIGGSGKLTGYTGHGGTETKRALLHLEGAKIKD